MPAGSNALRQREGRKDMRARQGPIKEGSTGSAQRGKRSEYRTFVHAYDIGAEHKSTQLNAEEILMSKSYYL